jgi:hypothetical protein
MLRHAVREMKHDPSELPCRGSATFLFPSAAQAKYHARLWRDQSTAALAPVSG